MDRLENKKIILTATPANWTGKLILPGAHPETASPQKANPETASPEKSSDQIGIPELSEILQILPKSLRARLRKSGYKKAGTNWSWSKESDELAEIIKKFKK